MISLPLVCNTIAQWLSDPEPQEPDWPAEAWEQVKFVCRVHGVGPLLHKRLAGIGWLEAGFGDWLAEQYSFNSRRVARMQAELAAILALFARNGVPLMPLKGSVLAATFFEDGGVRPMADLDLLIRPDQAAAAAELLVQLGYEQEVVHWKHTEFVKPDNRQVVSTEYEHPDNPRRLELHLHCRETFGGPTVTLTGLMWDRSIEGELLGEPAIIPGPGALWLHLLVHNTYHLWQGKGRLIQLVDLAQLTPAVLDENKSPVFLKKRAFEAGGMLLNSIDARFTYPSLALLRRYFPTAVDEALLAEQQARLSPRFRQWVDSLDLVNTSYLNPEPAGLYLFKALKFSQGRPREVAQALRFALLPSLEEISLDHPRLAQSKAPWLAYFLLPVDWARRLQASARK